MKKRTEANLRFGSFFTLHPSLFILLSALFILFIPPTVTDLIFFIIFASVEKIITKKDPAGSGELAMDAGVLKNAPNVYCK